MSMHLSFFNMQLSKVLESMMPRFKVSMPEYRAEVMSVIN